MLCKKYFILIICLLITTIVFSEVLSDEKNKLLTDLIIRGDIDKLKICYMTNELGHPQIKNKDGESAFTIAMKNNKPEIIKFLLGIIENKFKWVIPEEGLRLRESPNTNGRIIGLMQLSDKVKFLDTFGEDITISGATGKWTLVEWNGKYGWSFGGFLSDNIEIDLGNLSQSELKTKLEGLWFLAPDNMERIIDKQEQFQKSCPVNIYSNLIFWCNGEFIGFSKNKGQSIFSMGLYATSAGASGVYDIYEKPLRIVCNFAYYPEPGDDGEITYRTLEFPIVKIDENSITIKDSDKNLKYQKDTSILYEIIKTGKMKDFEKYISNYGINILFYGEITSLHLASYLGNIEMIEYLMKNGTKKDAKNFLGETPLHYAVKGGSLETVKYLLKKGFSPEAKSLYGFKPIDLSENEEINKLLIK